MKVKLMTVAAALSGAVMLFGTAAPASAATTGKERFTFVLSFPQPSHSFKGTATGSGLVSGTGTISGGEGDTFKATIKLPQGRLFVTVTSGPSTDRVNAKACTLTTQGSDTFVVTGGTGAFAGASGSGTDTSRGTLVFPTKANGTCNFDKAPIAGTFVVQTNAFDLTVR